MQVRIQCGIAGHTLQTLRFRTVSEHEELLKKAHPVSLKLQLSERTDTSTVSRFRCVHQLQQGQHGDSLEKRYKYGTNGLVHLFVFPGSGT